MSADKKYCRHYNGMGNSDRCDAGVIYRGVERKSFEETPCFNPEFRHNCSQAEEYTAEEVAESEQRLKTWIDNFNKFMKRETEFCPQCGTRVNFLRQVSRCVYAYPCGCRVCQGRVPDVWQQ
ncbi:MAG: hypothetical protein WC455_27020 [Dehalococcoidia bacterium]|jgi:hypothetical protein